MWSAQDENCSLHLLETRHPKNYFHRGHIYGFEDDVLRFIYFARAILEYLKIKKSRSTSCTCTIGTPAALAPLLREIHKEIQVKAIVLSIHNLEYQGQCSVYDLAAIGLSKEHIVHLRTGSHYNLLKGAIHYADAIVAVSPSYAREILTQEYGFKLDDELRNQKKKLSGILNGLDLQLWDPTKDPALDTRYSATDPIPQILAAKQSNRKNIPLKSEKGLWFGTITRLVPQKGPKLIEAALREVVRRGGAFVLLGSSPIPEMQRHFEALKKEFAQNQQVHFHLDYDEDLAHRIYAALDFLVVPSLFEPCGLTQFVAMRYGTVPIVRATGGLKDTVFDCDDIHIPAGQKNGFVFLPPKPEAVVEAIARAFLAEQKNPSSRHLLIKHGMATDFGWEKPAQQYLAVYQNCIKEFPRLS